MHAMRPEAKASEDQRKILPLQKSPKTAQLLGIAYAYIESLTDPNSQGHTQYMPGYVDAQKMWHLRLADRSTVFFNDF